MTMFERIVLTVQDENQTCLILFKNCLIPLELRKTVYNDKITYEASFYLDKYCSSNRFRTTKELHVKSDWKKRPISTRIITEQMKNFPL